MKMEFRFYVLMTKNLDARFDALQVILNPALCLFICPNTVIHDAMFRIDLITIK